MKRSLTIGTLPARAPTGRMAAILGVDRTTLIEWRRRQVIPASAVVEINSRCRSWDVQAVLNAVARYQDSAKVGA